MTRDDAFSGSRLNVCACVTAIVAKTRYFASSRHSGCRLLSPLVCVCRSDMTRIALDNASGARAVATLDGDGDLVELRDMPSIEETVGRRATNATLLVSLRARAHASVAFCEWVSARPIDAKTAAFSFGRARGVIEGSTAALGLPIAFLTPPTWKRLAAIPAGVENKDQARARAIAKWPSMAELFARKKDIDRAEAALIGWAGLQMERRL